jgi:hypothetical protein
MSGNLIIPQILLNKNFPPDTICGHNDVIYSKRQKDMLLSILMTKCS